MTNDIILIDGIRYCRYSPKSEDEFERMIVENAALIFGEEAIYLDIKKKIANALGEGTIPDGFLFYPELKRFVMVEVELSSHPVYEHISKQVNKFISAFSNYKSRQKLASTLKEYIEDEPALAKRMKPLLGTKGLYEFLEFDVFEPLAEAKNFEVIVIIEDETPAVCEALAWLNPRPRLIEAAVYAREGAESVKAMRFEPQFNFVPQATGTTLVSPPKPKQPEIQPSNGEIQFPIPVYATYKGNRFETKLFADGSMEVDGEKFKSPSGAGKAVKGGKSTNGWIFWKIKETDATIDKLYNIIKNMKGEVEISTSKVDAQSFLESVEDTVMPFFRELFKDIEEKGYAINWGVKGFSVNKKIDKEKVSLFECYPPNSPWGQSILVCSHETMARKVADYYRLKEQCKSRLMDLGFFVPSGKKSVTWVVDKSTDKKKLSDFWRVIDDFAEEVRLK